MSKPPLTPLARVVGLGLVVLTLIVGMVAAVGLSLIVQGRNQNRTNGDMVLILLAVSGCTLKDTPAECRQRQVDRAAQEGNIRVADVDCRIRRALAGLPPPPFGVVCTDP